MSRFFIEQPPCGDLARLAARETRHALRIYRLRRGDSITLFDGTGWEYEAEIGEKRGSQVEVVIRSKRFVDREPAVEVSLAVAVPKGKRMAQLVRGCAELGAAWILPLVTDRSFSRPARNEIGTGARWQQIAVEASKQSGRTRVTRVASLRDLGTLLQSVTDYSRATVASTDPGSAPLRRLVGRADRGGSILVLIGPEGDFTPQEIAAILEAGCLAFTLGASILRVDTAAVAALATLLGLTMR